MSFALATFVLQFDYTFPLKKINKICLHFRCCHCFLLAFICLYSQDSSPTQEEAKNGVSYGDRKSIR